MLFKYTIYRDVLSNDSSTIAGYWSRGFIILLKLSVTSPAIISLPVSPFPPTLPSPRLLSPPPSLSLCLSLSVELDSLHFHRRRHGNLRCSGRIEGGATVPGVGGHAGDHLRRAQKACSFVTAQLRPVSWATSVPSMGEGERGRERGEGEGKRTKATEIGRRGMDRLRVIHYTHKHTHTV